MGEPPVELLITGRYNVHLPTLEELRACTDREMVERALLLGEMGLILHFIAI